MTAGTASLKNLHTFTSIGRHVWTKGFFCSWGFGTRDLLSLPIYSTSISVEHLALFPTAVVDHIQALLDFWG